MTATDIEIKLVILQRARELLTPPAHWTQGAAARDKAGRPRISPDDKAVCFCAVGAVSYVGDKYTFEADLDDRTPVLETISELDTTVMRELDGSTRYGLRPVAAFNDTPGRTHAEVLSLFDTTIERLSQS